MTTNKYCICLGISIVHIKNLILAGSNFTLWVLSIKRVNRVKYLLIWILSLLLTGAGSPTIYVRSTECFEYFDLRKLSFFLKNVETLLVIINLWQQLKITGSKIKLLIHGYYFYLTEIRRKQYFDHLTGKRLPFALGRLAQHRRNQCLIGRTYENRSLIFRYHTFLNCWPAEAGAGCLSRPAALVVEYQNIYGITSLVIICNL